GMFPNCCPACPEVRSAKMGGLAVSSPADGLVFPVPARPRGVTAQERILAVALRRKDRFTGGPPVSPVAPAAAGHARRMRSPRSPAPASPTQSAPPAEFHR